MADRSRDQERAAFAWAELEKLAAGPGGLKKEYVSNAKGLPAMIVANGLMQALAFERSRGGAKAADSVLRWLQLQPELGAAGSDSFKAVMKSLHEGDSDLYMLATEEALEVLRWIRQFAAALGRDAGGTP